MKLSDDRYFNGDRHLTLTFVVLIAIILGGNGLLVWQFRFANKQTDRLTAVSRQLMAVQELQEQFLTFHVRIGESAHSKDAGRLVTEAQPLLSALLEQTRKTRETLTPLPSEIPINPLEAIEITLPGQVERITALAKAGDWDAVNLRLDNQLRLMEMQTSALVNRIDREVDAEMTQAVATMGNMQSRALLIVPTTAIFTVVVAAFFGWSIARRIIALRIDERVQERTRIARELHDTLLQNVQGLMLKIDAIARRIPVADPARRDLEKTLDYADQVLAEGRDRVRSLRGATVSDGELLAAFQQVAREFSPERTAMFKTVVEGSVKELHPLVLEESYSIGREAIINALLHSGGCNVEAEIIYDSREFRLRIRDDGRGIDPDVLEKGGRADHWGLQGMRERANRIGGQLKVWSRPESGTEVILMVPAAAAYRSLQAKSTGSRSGIPAAG
jgi:signal transduction histidine kinase